MRTSLIFIAAVFFSCCPVSVQAEDLSGNFSVTIGVLSSDDDFSKSFDLDERVEIGVTGDAGQADWPVIITAAYFFSYGNGEIPENRLGLLRGKDTDMYSTQMYLGIKKIFNTSPFVKPYVAGGLCSINLFTDISYDHEYDSAAGGWIGAGAYFPISNNWQLNLEWRRSKVKVELFDHHVDAGGDHFDLSLGYHFPK